MATSLVLASLPCMSIGSTYLAPPSFSSIPPNTAFGDNKNGSLIPYLRYRPVTAPVSIKLIEQSVHELITDILFARETLIKLHIDQKKEKNDVSNKKIKKELITELAKIYNNISFSLKQNLTFQYYSTQLKHLKEKQAKKYKEMLDAEDNDASEQRQALNLELISINKHIIKLQIMIAGMLLYGRSGLTQETMIRNAALWTLEGTVNSAMALQEELRFRIVRLQAGKKIQEIKLTDIAGQFIRTFDVGTITISMTFPDGKKEPQISIFQHKWINTDRTLAHIKTFIKKRKFKEAFDKLNLLLQLYPEPVDKKEDAPVYTELLKLSEQITKIAHVKKAEEAAIPEEISNSLKSLQSLIKHKKQTVMVPVAYKSLPKALRAQLHTIGSNLYEYCRTLKYRAYIEFYAQKLKIAVKKHHLSKSNKETINKGLEEISAWAKRGFVHPKEKTENLLNSAIKEIAANQYFNAQKNLSDATKQLTGRLIAIDQINMNVRKRAFRLYDEWRDENILAISKKILTLMQNDKRDEALILLEDMNELFPAKPLLLDDLRKIAEGTTIRAN